MPLFLCHLHRFQAKGCPSSPLLRRTCVAVRVGKHELVIWTVYNGGRAADHSRASNAHLKSHASELSFLGLAAHHDACNRSGWQGVDLRQDRVFGGFKVASAAVPDAVHTGDHPETNSFA